MELGAGVGGGGATGKGPVVTLPAAGMAMLSPQAGHSI